MMVSTKIAGPLMVLTLVVIKVASGHGNSDDNGENGGGHSNGQGPHEHTDKEDDHSDRVRGDDDGHVDHIVARKAKLGNCVDQQYTFDNTGEDVEYLELAGTLSQLESVTICARVMTDGNGAINGTIASYSTNSNPNMIAVGGKMGKDGPLLRFEVNGEVKTLNKQFAPNTKHCFCMEYHLTHGRLLLYFNGNFRKRISFKYAKLLPANGTIVLGQRQTKLGGFLDESLAFSGTIEGFTIWGRALSKSERMTFCKEGRCPNDALVKPGPGDVTTGRIFPSSTCPSYKFTLDNTGKKVEYIQILKTFEKPYNFLTMCAKVRSDGNGILPGAVGSYATEDMIDALYLGGEIINGKPYMQATINKKTILEVAPFQPNMVYLNCVLYYTPQGRVLSYINGFLGLDLYYNNTDSIPAGGTIILGQKQGIFGGSFDRSKAYNGEIADLMIWDRILSAAEVKAMVTLNECPDGAIIDLSPTNARKVSMAM